MSHQYSQCFHHPHYAVMRHAKDVAGGLDQDSVQICKEVIGELAKHVSGRRVSICHSPLSRAYLTAKVVEEAFKDLGIETLELSSVPWLKSDSCMISHDLINTVCTNHSESFTLMITHLPDIEYFVKMECNPANCTLIAMEFLISGNRST